ncbi:sporulation protein [Halobaculum sp. MBLA0143]|uniref:sporulation protein n=1 Tax=Halobaculum sp. MBLA0143 TaxID=3079933 RepID=UPI003524AA1C
MNREMSLGRVVDGDSKLTVWLDRRRAETGDTATVVVDFVGRNVVWEVESISVSLSVHYFGVDEETETAELSHVEVVGTETCSPELRTTRTADLPVPAWSPYTVGGVGVAVESEIRTRDETVTERRHLSVSSEEIEAAFETVVERGFIPRGSRLVAVSDDETPPYEQQFPLTSPGSRPTAAPDERLVCRPTPDGVDVTPPGES